MLFRNAASMSMLEGNQAMFGSQILYGDVLRRRIEFVSRDGK